MKYTQEIKVNVPIDEFVQKLDNIDHLKHWQRGVVSTENISGDLRLFGDKMRFIYRFGNHTREITETITKRNLPNEFHVNYTSKTSQNLQQNFYKKTTDGGTIWTSYNEFVPLNLKMRLILFLMPNAFKKQSIIYMRDFKNFAENGISIAHA
jgi:hypothetical protein